MRTSFVVHAFILVFGLAWISQTAWAQRVEGIDVSEFQGTMTWSKAVTAGVKFAFIRVGRGGTTAAEGVEVDANYQANFIGATSSGILNGAYLRARPDLSELTDAHSGPGNDQPTSAQLMARADDESQHLFDLAHPSDNSHNYLTTAHLRPVLDLENTPYPTQHPGTEALTQASMTFWANEFLNHFKALSGGIEPIVYVNSDYDTSRLNSSINSPSRRTLWLARPYDPSAPPNAPYSSTSEPQTPPGSQFVANGPYGVWNNSANPDSSWDFWQHGSGTASTYGSTGGVSTVDLDVFNGNLTQLQTMLIPEPATLLLVPVVALLASRHRRRAR